MVNIIIKLLLFGPSGLGQQHEAKKNTVFTVHTLPPFTYTLIPPTGPNQNNNFNTQRRKKLMGVRRATKEDNNYTGQNLLFLLFFVSLCRYGLVGTTVIFRIR